MLFIVGDIVYGHRNGAPIKKVVNPKVLGPQFIIEGGRGRTSSWEREEGRASEGLGAHHGKEQPFLQVCFLLILIQFTCCCDTAIVCYSEFTFFQP